MSAPLSEGEGLGVRPIIIQSGGGKTRRNQKNKNTEVQGLDKGQGNLIASASKSLRTFLKDGYKPNT